LNGFAESVEEKFQSMLRMGMGIPWDRIFSFDEASKIKRVKNDRRVKLERADIEYPVRRGERGR